MGLAADLKIDVDAVSRDMAAAKGLPAHFYTDQAIFDFEMDAVFKGTWVYFGPAAKLRAEGDVAIGQVGRVPVVVARAGDGALYASVNVCRHRNYTVATEDAKHCRLLRCKYHAWAYDLKGNLVAAPDTQDMPGFSKAEHGLIPVKVEEWGPMVFVNTDVNAPSLHEAMPQLNRWAGEKPFVLDPDAYELHTAECTSQRCNWKLYYDNATECYHCNHIHGASFGDAFSTSDGSYSFELDGLAMTYSFTGKAPIDGRLASLSYQSMQLFPGGFFIQHDDIMILGRLTPTGPTDCDFEQVYMVRKGADTTVADQWVALWEKTFAEDKGAVEVQQVNMGAIKMPFQYVAGREDPTIFINRLIWDRYLAVLGDPVQHYAAAAE